MLKRKMLRDIINYKVQFISIFLMAFIGVFVFTGLVAETNGFEDTVNAYYEQTNLADGSIYSDYLVDEFLEQVYLLGATTQMERQLVVDSQVELDGKPDIRLHFVENNTISKFYLVEGKPLDINDSEGVWLDKSFADARNLKIGDEISFESEGFEIKKVIRGLGYSPEYIYSTPAYLAAPNHTSNGFAYMSHSALPSDNMPYNVLNVKFDGKPKIYSELVDYRLNGYYTLFQPQSNHFSVNAVSDISSQQKALTLVFPAIFILISMLMLLTTMKRIISHQRIQIGVLKANGFKNQTIVIHYISYGVLLVTLGAILGAILGPIVFHTIAHPSREVYFTLPFWNSVGFDKFIIVIVVVGLLSLIVSYLSIEDIINEPASDILKSKAPKSPNSIFTDRLKILKMLSFNIRWNYRDIKRNKFRSIMAIIGVIGCTVLLVSGFGAYEQMDNSKYWYFNEVNHFESKLIIDDNTDISQIDAIANNVNGDKIMESTIEILTDNPHLASLQVLDGTDLITIMNDNHEKIEISNDEVSISQKMADLFDVKVGDTFNFSIVGSNNIIKVKIDKIHATPYVQGIIMSSDKLEELGIDYAPTSIITSQHVNESYDGVKSIIYLDDMIKGWDQMEKTPNAIIWALLVFAVVLAVVILYNMNLLSFIEMENDIVTLKVLGFKSGYLTKLLATQSFFFIIIGFLLGIPISYYILTLLMPAFGNKLYLVPSISPSNLVISFIIIMSVSIIMNLYFSRKIKNLDMVDSLKDFE
ncbi:MAG: ABC transporter permease [Methanobrevibacter sp.]|nr:ABC transporter permease [Methanobrevibacter sp.]